MTLKEVFGSNGPISRVGSLLADILIINLVWLVLGGPAILILLNVFALGTPTVMWNLGEFTISLDIIGVVLTLVLIGPGTTAAYAALGKVQRHEDGYLLKDYWKSYKQNFLQSLITIPLALFTFMMLYSMWVEINNQALFGKLLYVTLPVQGFVGIELIFIFTYIHALLARFEMSTKDLLKYSFLIANKHLPSTLIMVVLFTAILAVTFLWNLGIGFFGFGVYVFLSSYLLERAFRNYMPEEDLDNDYLSDDPREDADTVRDAVRKADTEAQKQMQADRQAIIDRYTKGKK